ncbi:unnamed protein product (macronuclear) [Paramecium tetraurelia]|uniref:Peptidase M24 domain-containing protein n=1 Tax=Paramecium tetraurelia TaxID=5888 RepID=A0C9C0_PARTE|nr:uncharacterized protein GSPATT00006693001 [Paramecium tetraurelia]CAK67387.1 unnamed protein product [Paramecium tetraurelia]|eukprot:XP_001434784.1 hypothetical protein (macronuclear) [Paramecium tetraurelia strain d4-2]
MDQQTEQDKLESIATPGVLDKYQNAGKITNIVLEKVIAKLQPDADIASICAFGDQEINGELQKVYNKKGIEKGLAFPTTISVNQVCGHYSPLKSESSKLVKGDVAKIELGVHIDGYIAIAAHTVVVGEDQVEGQKADVILAAYQSVQALFRSIKPGVTNTALTKIIQQVADDHKCTPLEGVLSHEVKRHFIDGNKVIINRETQEQRVDEEEIQVNDVFVLDVYITTGDGKTKESELRTTVYKRALDRQYQLKTKHGRAFMQEVYDKYPSLCFSLRAFEDEITAKMAIQECAKHELLNPYPVLTSQNGIVAQFTITVAVLANSTLQVSGLKLDETKFKPAHDLNDAALKELLKLPMDKDSQKKRHLEQKQKA